MKILLKKTILLLFNIYKVLISPILFVLFGKGCRYKTTCSEYTKAKIGKYGIIKGLKKGAKRLATCHSFNLKYTN